MLENNHIFDRRSFIGVGHIASEILSNSSFCKVDMILNSNKIKNMIICEKYIMVKGNIEMTVLHYFHHKGA